MSGDNIQSVLQETRSFPPPAEFTRQANISSEAQYQEMWQRAKDDPAGFWGDLAQNLHWFKKWDKVREWNAPWVKWFQGGTLNVSYNCLDRHLKTQPDKTAIIFEADDGKITKISYQALYHEVCRFANALKRFGVAKGDRVIIYMPLTPEGIVSMLACARLGAIHEEAHIGAVRIVRLRRDDNRLPLGLRFFGRAVRQEAVVLVGPQMRVERREDLGVAILAGRRPRLQDGAGMGALHARDGAAIGVCQVPDPIDRRTHLWNCKQPGA